MSTDDQPDDEGPITPEVVRRRANARKRRVVPGEDPVDGPAPDDAAPIPGVRTRGVATGRTFRLACFVMVGLGLLELFLSVPTLLDPAKTRCDRAQFEIDAANDDDEDFNDVTLPEGVEEADDLSCADAISLAGQIPADEDDEPDGSYISESAFVTQGAIFGVLGIAHGVVGFFLFRTKKKVLRNVALVLTALAVLPLAALGILGLAVILLIVYGLGFSADAKALFPRNPDMPSMFGPRSRRPAS